MIEDGRLVKQALSDYTEIDAEPQSVIAEMEVVAGLIEKSITVHNDGRLVFTFTNGSEETVMM